MVTFLYETKNCKLPIGRPKARVETQCGSMRGEGDLAREDECIQIDH